MLKTKVLVVRKPFTYIYIFYLETQQKGSLILKKYDVNMQEVVGHSQLLQLWKA